MRIKNPEKRLTQYWGEVDKKHTLLISNWIKGSRILDIGCGYGTTSLQISSQSTSTDCVGIDYDLQVIEKARLINPLGNFSVENCEHLSFKDNSFDTLIMRDSLHHLLGEADFEKIKSEIKRVVKKNGRLIILDPNVNLILRFLRFLTSHKDEQCTYEDALIVLKSLDATLVHSEFNTIIDLPLSGGYIGLNFVPKYKPLYQAINTLENIITNAASKLNLGRVVCLRYFLVADFK